MRGFNKVILAGNLVRDPESRYAGNDKQYTKFTIASNKVWKNKNGEKQEEVDFIPCIAWGPLAGVIEQYVHKGDPILVEGAMQVKSYEKDGEKKYSTTVNVTNIVLLGSGGSRGSSNSGASYPSKAKPSAGYNDNPEFTGGVDAPGGLGETGDADIPF